MERILSANWCSDRHFLFHLASLESQSSHPIAGAVLRLAEERNIEASADVVSYKTIPGAGASAVVEGRFVVVGNVKLAAAGNGWSSLGGRRAAEGLRVVGGRGDDGGVGGGGRQGPGGGRGGGLGEEERRRRGERPGRDGCGGRHGDGGQRGVRPQGGQAVGPSGVPSEALHAAGGQGGCGRGAQARPRRGGDGGGRGERRAGPRGGRRGCRHGAAGSPRRHGDRRTSSCSPRTSEGGLVCAQARACRTKIIQNIALSILAKAAIVVCVFYMGDFPVTLNVMSDAGVAMAVILNGMSVMWFDDGRSRREDGDHEEHGQCARTARERAA